MKNATRPNNESARLTPPPSNEKTLIERRCYSEWTIEIHSLEDDGYQARAFLNAKERFTVGGTSTDGAMASAVKIIGELGSLYTR